MITFLFFFSSRRRHTRWTGDWSSDVCSSDLLVVVDPLEALFERQEARWRQLDRNVRAGGAHVGQVLLAADLHDHVALARVLADHLAAVDLVAGPEEENGALLQRLDGVGGRLSAFFGDQR